MEPDYFNLTKTENGRVSYPLSHIPNIQESGEAGHPTNIIFLSCDAFGVMPPIAKLTEDQAVYHFLSGYTAKVAGTERGVKEPTATFSAGFGSAFLTRPANIYGGLLREKLRRHNCNVYLLNTGWSGGEYGVGSRMPIDVSRRCINAILSGDLEHVTDWEKDPVFRFEVPREVPGVDSYYLDPKSTWTDGKLYDKKYQHLAYLYAQNFDRYLEQGVDYSEYGPTNGIVADKGSTVASH